MLSTDSSIDVLEMMSTTLNHELLLNKVWKKCNEHTCCAGGIGAEKRSLLFVCSLVIVVGICQSVRTTVQPKKSFLENVHHGLFDDFHFWTNQDNFNRFILGYQLGS